MNFNIKQKQDHIFEVIGIFVLIFIIVYTASFMMSWGPICWVLAIPTLTTPVIRFRKSTRRWIIRVMSIIVQPIKTMSGRLKAARINPRFQKIASAFVSRRDILKDYNEELTRRGLWDSTMAGGVANIWGNLDGATSDASVAYPHKEWIKTYAVFFKHRFLNGMVRDNDLTDGVCLKLPQHTHFVFYKENTDSITFDLSDIPAKLPCIAVDACKPYEEIKIGLRAAGKTTWKAPYVSDWAVAVGAFGSK